MRAEQTFVPQTVRTATLLLWALVGVLVLRTVLTFVLFDSLMDSWVESRRSGLPREIAEQGAPAYRAFAIVGLVIIGGVIGLCAAMIPKARNWARVLATAFCVLGVIGGLIGLLQPSTALFKILGLIQAVVSLVAVVLLWVGQSNAFFRRS